MKLTAKLLGYLHRVFNKDAKAFTAVRIAYDGGLTWAISDGVLSTTVNGGSGVNLSVDLSAHTLTTLVGYIAAQTGYSVTFVDPDRASLSALVLLDTVGDLAKQGGDILPGYTSLLWAWLETNARELKTISEQIDQMPDQMTTQGADGYWLDEIGSYYNVPREQGEADAAYGARIIAETLRPRSNNIALENAITVYTGQAATVTDVAADGGVAPLYNAAYNHNAAITHNAAVTTVYGLFDIEYAYDLINGSDLTAFQDSLRALVARLRAAGTHLRALALQSSDIGDTFKAPTDNIKTFAVTITQTDTFTAPTEGSLGFASIMDDFAEAFAAPAEDDNIVITYLTSYDGSHLYNKKAVHKGGLIYDETLDGETVNSVTPVP